MRALVVSLALWACASPQPPQNAAEAFAPLIGCWRGAFENQPDLQDERCFQTLGEHVVDTHAVRPTDYAGESTYHLDETSGEIVFAYAGNDGGRSNGSVRVEGDRFVFPPHTHRGAGGIESRLRSTWRMVGPDRYVAFSEREEEGVWRPFMRIAYERADDISPPP